MIPHMHPRGRPRATARDLRSHVLNDQIVIQSVLTHEFDAPALILIEIRVVSHSNHPRIASYSCDRINMPRN